MKESHTEPTARVRRRPELDPPRVLVAGATTGASWTIAQALREAGYVVSTTLAGPDVCRDLRSQKAMELLVLDASENPSTVASSIDAVRAIDWAVPIILVARPDPVLRAEAERLGVEAILEAPVGASELRRTAKRIVPVVPEVMFDLAG